MEKESGSQDPEHVHNREHSHDDSNVHNCNHTDCDNHGNHETIHHDHDHDHNHSTNHHDHDHNHAGSNQDNVRDQNHNHGHSHEILESPGQFEDRTRARKRKYNSRAFCVGIGGPVGSGKTALMLGLCLGLRDKYNLCAVTNDIFTREDGEFLIKHGALPSDRIAAVETGGCPHAAIREDITANLIACEELTAKHNCNLILLESGGDNLAADFSRELADYTIYVIDTSGGDKIPRKGGPGITQSDLLIINKTDLSEAVGASLEVMERDSKLMRNEGPFIFAQVKHGVGVCEIIQHIETAFKNSVK